MRRVRRSDGSANAAVGSAVALQAQLDVMRGEPQKAVDAYTAFIESIRGSAHDRTLSRSCSVDARINQMNAAMWRSIRAAGSIRTPRRWRLTARSAT